MLERYLKLFNLTFKDALVCLEVVNLGNRVQVHALNCFPALAHTLLDFLEVKLSVFENLSLKQQHFVDRCQSLMRKGVNESSLVKCLLLLANILVKGAGVNNFDQNQARSPDALD